ncbi:MAG: TRAP transporter large permease [Deltaproteobacteria bacterium]|nr:TRAP transporter large permease [Deltaproteobacteria bacterium]
MDPLAIAGIMLVLLVFFIFLGIYVGVSLAFLSFAGLWWISGNVEVAIRLLGTTSFAAIMDYVFGVIPFFVAMGLLSNVSGASGDLYTAFGLLTRRIRGGLGVATVFSNAVFAAITGVSVASAAVFSKISLPEMLKAGYEKKFALGVVAGSSVLGMLIPPSVLFVIYGVISEQAIGRLFMAGVLPGLVLTAVYSFGIYIMVSRRPRLIMSQEALDGRKTWEKIGMGQFVRAFFNCWGVVLLIIVTLGSIWFGFCTPTEAGAVGAFGALVLGLGKRQMNLPKFWRVLMDTGITTSGIFFLLIAAQMYSRMLAISGLAQWSSEWVISLQVSPIVIILMFLLIFFIMGCFIDSVSIMLLTLPLMLPIVQKLGYDLIWFGIVSTVVIEMGLVTPPFGMVVFAMKAALGEEARIEEIFQGSYPFLFMLIVTIAILIFFPGLSTWLPSLM